MAVLANGASVALGVQAEDETEALCLARERLAASGHLVREAQAIDLPGRRER